MTNSETLDERMRRLMKQSKVILKVILFMMGTLENPRCGFSRQICVLLRDNSVEFLHFDTLADEQVRQVRRLIACSYNGQPSPTASTTSFHQRRSFPLAVQTVLCQICRTASPLYHSTSQDRSP